MVVSIDRSTITHSFNPIVHVFFEVVNWTECVYTHSTYDMADTFTN